MVVKLAELAGRIESGEGEVTHLLFVYKLRADGADVASGFDPFEIEVL